MSLPNPQPGSEAGTLVSGPRDLNGDGYSDIAVGAYLYDNGHNNEGILFIFHGSAGGANQTPAWTIEGNRDDVHLGRFASSAGDVNSNGYDDIIVSAYPYTKGPASEGRLFLFNGPAGEPPPTATPTPVPTSTPAVTPTPSPVPYAEPAGTLLAIMLLSAFLFFATRCS